MSPSRRCRLRTCLALSLVLVVVESVRGDETLDRALEAILRRPELSGSTFGVEVRRVDSGETVLAHEKSLLLAPASTTKLVTCAGALLALGADHRFTTRVVRTGPIDEGTVEGDLVLVATGDPNLSQRPVDGDRLRYVDHDHTYAGFVDADVVPGDPLAVLRSLADQIVKSGVRKVTGDVIVDDGFFSERDDDFVGPFSAFCLNDNVIDVSIAPGTVAGAPARVDFRPNLPIFEVGVTARTVTADGRLRLSVEQGSSPTSFVVSGTIPLGRGPVLRVASFRDSALVGALVLAHLLEEKGVTIQGSRRTSTFGPSVYSSYEAVATHRSPPLAESIKVILKTSHNLHATMLPVIVGAEVAGRGSRAHGFRVMSEHLAALGVACESVILQSGSGGDRADRLSAGFLVDLLVAMTRREDFPLFLDALPVGGADGTLVDHLRDPSLHGRVRAKTGTLVYRGSFGRPWVYLSKALAGYLDLRSSSDPNALYAFSITIANTVCDSRPEGVELLFGAQEEILKAVVDWHRRDLAARQTESHRSSATEPASSAPGGGR